MRHSKNDRRITFTGYEPVYKAVLSRALWEIHAHVLASCSASATLDGDFNLLLI